MISSLSLAPFKGRGKSKKNKFLAPLTLYSYCAMDVPVMFYTNDGNHHGLGESHRTQ
jgi:hypothetical protein